MANISTEEVQVEQEHAQRLMAMGQMAASLAHEIRNPLGSMELFCSLLKKDLSQESNSLYLAEQIHSGIRRLDRIISNCLQFAREVVPQRKPVEDVEQLLQEVLSCVQNKTQESAVELSLESIGSGELEVDSYQINQALLNLVINAIDAAQERATQAEINFQPEVIIRSDLTKPDVWKLAVVDNGMGLAESVQEQMFDPFFSTKSEGVGLGLAIVHSIVNAHQGKISFFSKKGVGTTVVVEIPRTGAQE